MNMNLQNVQPQTQSRFTSSGSSFQQNIQGSRYYADNKYLNTIFQKQQRMGRPV